MVFTPSCTRKYLDTKVQHPNSHSFTTKISSVFTLTDSTVFNRIIMPFRNMGVFQRKTSDLQQTFRGGNMAQKNQLRESNNF